MADVYDKIILERGPDITLASDTGIDVSVSEDEVGSVIVVGALPGPGEQPRRRISVRVSGDDCVSVSAVPHVMVDETGTVVRDPDCGVLYIGSTCKPCCQCDDYSAAVWRLHEVFEKLASIRSRMAGTGKDYKSISLDHRDTTQPKYVKRICAIDNVRINCSRMGGKTVVSSTDGESRIVTGSGTAAVSVMNPTPTTVHVSGFTLKPVSGAAEIVEIAWSATRGRSGEEDNPSGTSKPHDVWLLPGGTLSVSAVLEFEGALVPSFSASVRVANEYGSKTLRGGA